MSANSNNALTILSQCSNICLAVVTIISVIVLFITYQYSRRKASIEKACELARIYAQEIIPKFCFIMQVLTHSGIYEKIKKAFPVQEIEMFNVKEMEMLCKKNGVSYSEIDRMFLSINPQAIYESKLETIINGKAIKELEDYYLLPSEDASKVKYNNYALNADFVQTLGELQNLLEWFSMNFTRKLADEKIVYQSLHQTFLANVHFLYFTISKNNKTNSDKYFTNIILLFNAWENRLKKEKKKEDQAEMKIYKKTSKVKNLGATL